MWLDFGMADGTTARDGARRQATRVGIALGVVMPVLALALWIGPSSPARAQDLTSWTLLPPATTAPAPKPAPPPAPPKPKPPMPERTILVTPVGTVPTFDAPGGRNNGSLGQWYGYQITTPQLARYGDWVQVRLPQRPNGGTAWVRAGDVSFSSTIYRIVIRRGMADLTVYQEGWPLMTVPVGIGKAKTPTPLGSFFVAVIETPGPPGYGP
ncbi:MAG: ErfK/YbiS/YcfS/YnhG family protein, partial [Acidimicrobiales bacterium]|nr:ErfK/YbiS/YcfS/YnhG family protein [Acidimicrobiales bacterium]